MNRWALAFGKFCYEFVVGDTPELAIGVAIVIVGGWALTRAIGSPSFWFIPVAVATLLAASLWRGVSGRQS
ncbi:MAG TPA: hypothetical protein VMW80_09120 [Candidatus Dormibacteraeota bacterium]|nr:hypothetical protein [Candidatus Dormibacteraeota bacterium]